MQIEENIFLLDGAGIDSNVYVINNVMIDTGSGMYLEETLDQMKKYDIPKKQVKKIILTHEHFDHTGAAKKMKKKLNAKLVAYEKAKINDKTSLASEFETEFDTPEIDERVEEGDIINAGDFKFEVLHTPGHSPGSIVLWDKDKKLLVSGDLIFLDGFGRFDLLGGNEEKIKKSLQRIKKLGQINALLPGHGTPQTKNNIYEKGAIENILSEIDNF